MSLEQKIAFLESVSWPVYHFTGYVYTRTIVCWTSLKLASFFLYGSDLCWPTSIGLITLGRKLPSNSFWKEPFIHLGVWGDFSSTLYWVFTDFWTEIFQQGANREIRCFWGLSREINGTKFLGKSYIWWWKIVQFCFNLSRKHSKYFIINTWIFEQNQTNFY